MTKYLLYTTHRTGDKNKLTKEIKDAFQQNERKVFDSKGEIEMWVDRIVRNAHKNHPRCHPVRVEVGNSYTGGDFHVWGLGLEVNFLKFEI